MSVFMMTTFPLLAAAPPGRSGQTQRNIGAN
jgi:hypothetical protein